MDAVVIQHVDVSELPERWRARLPASIGTQVTIRIEEEPESTATTRPVDEAVEMLFGLWTDREDISDVQGYLRKLRAPRFGADGSRI